MKPALFPDMPEFVLIPARPCPGLRDAVEGPFERVAEGPCVELLGSGYYFAPFDKLSALDAARLIRALEGK